MSIAKFIRRATQPGNYTTQYGLPQSSVDYLNQPLPDISGIFSLPQATEITQEDITETESPVGLTEEQLRLLYPQTGGGDGPRGGGLFGNLDLSKSKTFTKDVYSDVLGPPGAFEFSPQEIKAYYNPTLGNYQTYEGKNVNPMFSNTGATFGLAGLVMNMMGLTPKTVGGFVPQSIRGYYDTPKDFINRITGATKRAKQQRALEEAAAAKINIQQYTGGGGGGGGGGTHTATKSASQAAANREGRRGGQYR
jgi:hypothetical protein